MAFMSSQSSTKIFPLALGAVGVVYGDIGTSPLYAFRESLVAAMGGAEGPVPHDIVLGVLSLIFWTLILIVTLKYVVLLLRADNHGEGGILSLMALAQNAMDRPRKWILALGVLGASLFYGDAVITPAISVLSAVEGMKLVTHHFEPYVVPIALVIIVGLFMLQQKGTEKVAWFFGPIMVVWFIVLALGGLMHIKDNPMIWHAINPYHAVYFLSHHGFAAMVALGSVFLAVTGAEALYADLGHFGKKPIRLAWLYCVMPALVLNYFGQGALLLAHPEAASNPFYLMYPAWALLPIVLLSTLATIIASQAVITGAYSLTHQAIQLGLLPRLRVFYTSRAHIGQIYMPQVTWILLVLVVVLIDIFRTSSALASAYGIAVTGTMVITAVLTFVIIRHKWQWKLRIALAIIAPLLLIDLVFLSANMTKVVDGGFISVLLSSLLFIMIGIWVRGTAELREQEHSRNTPMDVLIEHLELFPPMRVTGSAIYLSSDMSHAPSALLQNLRHNKVIHQQNLLMTLSFERVPYIADNQRMVLERLSADFTRVIVRFGYMESPNVTRALALLQQKNLPIDPELISFFISRRNIVSSASFGMPVWQDRIFIAMSRNATDAVDYFRIPRDMVIELGIQMAV